MSGLFAGIDPDDATFVVLHGATGGIVGHKAKRAQERFIPASTYKIANALIVMETGVVTGPDHLIAWDSEVPRDPGFWAAACSHCSGH